MPTINADRSLTLEGFAEELRKTGNPNIVFTVYKSNRGYSIDFLEKEIRVSVVFGGANHCEHYEKSFVSINGSLPWSSTDFEIGIKHLVKDDTWYHLYGGDGWGVHSYAKPDDLDDVLRQVLDGKVKKPIDFSSRKRSMTYRQRKNSQ